MQTNSRITRSIGLQAAVVATAFVTSSAWADGYQRRGIATIAGCANFGGFYVGGNIGWAMLTAHQSDLDGFTSPTLFQPASFAATDDNFTAGAQVGYNLQRLHRLRHRSRRSSMIELSFHGIPTQRKKRKV